MANKVKILLKNKLDETDHLSSNEANEEALNKSIMEIKEGKGIKVSLEALFLDAKKNG